MAFEGIKKKGNSLAARLQDMLNTDPNAFTLFTTLLFYLGLWRRKNDGQGFGAFYRKWLPRGIFACSIYATVVGLPVYTYQCLVAGDIQPVMESVGTLFGAVILHTHLYCLMFQTDKLREVFVEMDTVREMGKRLPYRSDAILLLNIRWMEFAVFGMVVCELINIIVSLVAYPMIYSARSFAFNEWFPFDILASPVFEIVFLVNGIRMSYLVTMVILHYITIWTLFVEIVGQYRILLHNINTMGRTSHKIWPGSHIYVAARYARVGCVVDGELRPMHVDDPKKPRKNPSRRLTNQETLKLCIQQHLSLKRFARLVQSTFEPILLLQLICSMVPTAFGIALITNMAKIGAKNITYFFLILACYLVLGGMCLICDEITEQDEGIRDALYGCDWLRVPKSFTRSMRIVMSNCNQPLVIKLAGFIPLNRENFYAMTKLTYSYTMASIAQFK